MLSSMESQLVHITSFNKRGWGIGRTAKGTVEVAGALASEEVEVEMGHSKKGRCRGFLRAITAPAPCRVSARCRHAPECGGCVWQHMDYETQVQRKEGQLRAFFGECVRPMVRCEDPWGYRNKMEFSFSQNKAGERFLGLVIGGSKGHVLNLQECHLVSPWFIEVLSAVRKWCEESGLLAYRMNDTGTLRTLILREGKRTGDKLIMLTVSGNPAFAIGKGQIARFVETVIEAAGSRDVSIFLRVQQAMKGNPTQFFEMHLNGPDHLREKCIVGGREFTFKISPSSFFQPNTFQAEKLYAEALKMIQGPKEHIMDLYAGIGTIGLICSQRAKRVTSIELNPYAVYDGMSNRELNGIEHCQMIKGDVGKVLDDLRRSEGFLAPDLVIVDPPRAGLDANALGHVKSLTPKEIIYISCNPAAQAANIQELAQAGYHLEAVQPVDQFPHTVHMETIALLRKV
jgi:23S rRNA (uracil1939-C5)-methyltransferase